MASLFRLLTGLVPVLFLWSAPAAAALTLNEVLYDPAGSDGGREFVELYNEEPTPLSLAGVELVFVNGADPDRPRVLWTGADGDRVPARGWFVIGGPEVAGADVSLSLSLQNGPDGLWLRRGSEVLDRLAWGEIEGVGEGAPAADVSGESLGRVPDGRDTQDNQRDFRSLDPPTPGAVNLPPTRWGVGPFRLYPPWLAEPGSLEVEVELTAEGWAEAQSGRWWMENSPQPAVELRLDPGESRSLRWTVAADASTDSLVLHLEAAAGTGLWTHPLRVGPGPVVLNEVMARPASGRPEWIEIHNRGLTFVDLAGWAIADADRQPRLLGAPARLEPGGFLLLSSHPEELRASPNHRPEGGWPALNQSDGEAGFADELLLWDSRGRVVDHLRWTQAELTVPGRSLERARVGERTPSVWIPAPGGSTPGRPNDTARQPLPEEGLQARPNPFSPDGDGQDDFLHVALHDDRYAEATQAEIFDLAGDSVRRLAPAGAHSLRQWIWDGRDERGRRVPAGAYVLLLRSGGGSGRIWRRLVAVGYH